MKYVILWLVYIHVCQLAAFISATSSAEKHDTESIAYNAAHLVTHSLKHVPSALLLLPKNITQYLYWGKTCKSSANVCLKFLCY